MRKNTTVSIIGGDVRQVFLADYFADKGYIVKTVGLDNIDFQNSEIVKCNDIANALNDTDIIVLGLPVTKNGNEIYAPLTDKKILLDDLHLYTNKSPIIFGGKVSSILEKQDEYKNGIIDYSVDDMFAFLNSIPTAEGCIYHIINDSPKTIDGMRCLITGFGRTAKILAQKLHSLNASVTITARKNSQLNEAIAYGYDICHLSELSKIIYNYDTIVNTVPSMVINKKILDLTDKNTLLIDLASLPGGIDFKYASSLGIKAIQALGLPGKIAPATAAEIIYKVICRNLEGYYI